MKKYYRTIVALLLITSLLTACSRYKVSLELPRDYPDDSLPIYDNSIIYEASDEDEEISIMAVSEDDIDDLTDFYKEVFGESNILIMEENDEKDEYSAEGILLDDGYSFEIEIEEASGDREKDFDSQIEITIDLSEIELSPDTVVNIPDMGLKVAIILNLDTENKDIYQDITIDDLESLTELRQEFAPLATITENGESSYTYFEIESLEGLQYAKNLETLSITDTKVSDISAIALLENLTTLALSKNELTDINAVKGLTNLTNLYLYHNNVSDISAIENLISLEKLGLSYNPITDLSPLAKLDSLVSLQIWDTQAQDLSVLLELDSLARLNADGEIRAANQDIVDELVERGCEIVR